MHIFLLWILLNYNGHIFTNTAAAIKQGYFCKKCSDDIVANRALPVIEEFCRKFNFKLITPYTRAKDLHKWKCTTCNTIIERTWDNLYASQKPHFKTHCNKFIKEKQQKQ